MNSALFTALTCFLILQVVMGVRDKVNAKSTSNISNSCWQEVESILFNSSHHYTAYYDATGKLSSGLVSGNLVSLGDFDRCTLLPRSLYCLADITAMQTLPGSSNSTAVSIVWGMCVVNTCNSTVLNNYVSVILERVFGVSWIEPHTVDIHCARSKSAGRGFWTSVGVLLFLVALAVIGTLLDVQYVHATSVKRDLLYHVSTNVRHLVGSRDGHMMWTTVDESVLSSDPVTSDSQTNDERASEDAESQALQRPPNARLLVEAFRYKPGLLVKLSQCFSVVRNMELLPARSVKSIPCLDGLRVMSFALLIFGRTALAMFQSDNLVNRQEMVAHSTNFGWQLVLNAFCAVDSFFLIGGLLVVYSAMNTKHAVDLSYIICFFVHRIIRLSPAIIVVMLFWLHIVPYIADGPLWYQLYSAIDKQQSYWWSTLLYVQNFYPTNLSNSCMSWLWYVAADFQLYCLSLVIVLLIHRFRIQIALAVLLISSIVVTATLIGVYHLNVDMASAVIHHNSTQLDSYKNIIWDKPYSHAAAYVVGAWLGYLLHCQQGQQVYMNRSFVACGWVLCLLVAFGTIFATYLTFTGDTFGTAGNVLYGCMRHVSWAGAVSWLVYCCCHQYAGPVGYILSWHIWTVLGKLTFGAYLTHGVWVAMYIYSQHQPLIMSSTTLFTTYLFVMVSSYLTAVVIFVVVEVPARNLEYFIRS